MAKKIKFPKPALVRFHNGQQYIDANARVIVHMPSIGVVHGVKCVEWFKQRGEPVPAGTPTVKQAEAAWKKQHPEPRP